MLSRICLLLKWVIQASRPDKECKRARMKLKTAIAKYYVGFLLATAAGVGGTAQAAGLLGFYIGAEDSVTRLNTDVLSILGLPPQLASTGIPAQLDRTSTHGTFFIGFRPVSLLGSELKYINFGHETS